MDVTEATFERDVVERSQERPVVVDFWAAWCAPCRRVAPEIEALALQYGEAVKFVKVDVDANRAVARRFGVRGIPNIGLFEDGKLTRQAVGARPRHAIEAELGLAAFATAAKQ
jgi:thioredoxin